jgi:hypothetical protein
VQIAANDIQIVCRPFGIFEREIFGNVEHIEKIDFNWNCFDIYEKVDGSLVKLWYNPVKSRWNISSQNKINNGDFPYDKYFKNNQEPFKDCDKNKTYMFELFKGKLIFIASRHNIDGYIDYTPLAGFLHVKCYYKSTDLGDAKNAVNVLRKMIDDIGVSFEGFVLIDDKQHCVKIKNDLFK